MDDAKLASLAREIRGAGPVVAMTGAGVSTASGIPDFRSPDGIWSEYDPNDFHISRFRADPEGFWLDRVTLIEDLFGDGIEPNDAHEALATLELGENLETLVTQNIDGLHRRAGSEDTIQLHGDGQRVVCTGCGRQSDTEPVMDRVRGGEAPPTCGNCGDVLKPDVVLFGEQLPRDELLRAQSAARSADVFLAIGSSLTVEPAASLPVYTVDNGGTLCVINLERTDLSDRATYDFRADVTEILPRLVDAVERAE